MLVYKCHACGAAGDALSLVAAVYGLDCQGAAFQKVMRIAEELAHGLEPTAAAPVQVPQAASAFAEVAAALVEVAPLTSQEDVVAYLEERRVLDEALHEGWGALPQNIEALREVEREMAERFPESWFDSGLADAAGRVVSRRHRVLLPWRGPDGLVRTLQRRLIGTDGEKKYLWPPALGPKWPFGVDQMASAPAGADIAFTEGAIDALSLRVLCRQHGIDLVVLGLPSASTWKPQWSDLAQGRPVDLALDPDEAGERGSKHIRDALNIAGITDITRTTPARADDWNNELLEAPRP